VQSWYAGAANVVDQLQLYENGLLFSYSNAQVQGKADGINTGPLANGTPLLAIAQVGAAYSAQLAANAFLDIESQHSLTYAAKLASGAALPSWLTFNPTTRTFAGTPPTGSAGALSIQVTATDGSGAQGSVTFDLGIVNAATNGTTGNDTLTGDANPNILNGLDGDDSLSGAAGNDELNGGNGNDTLDGGLGNDRMVGAAGNDVYAVDNTGDQVIEQPAEGTDLVQASVSYTLGSNVENLTLTGASALDGAGNAADNVLTGNSGNNTLRGGAGNDTLDPGTAGTDVLLGGTGNDTYVVARSSGITITEGAAEGTDTVQASVSYTLGQ
jgi:Ca2+-binding RTX toxin-like protein